MRFGEREREREREREKQFDAAKIRIKIWDINVDNIVISKLVKTETISKYLIGYLGNAIRPLILIMPKMSVYVTTFKIKEKINIK